LGSKAVSISVTPGRVTARPVHENAPVEVGVEQLQVREGEGSAENVLEEGEGEGEGERLMLEDSLWRGQRGEEVGEGGGKEGREGSE